MDETDSERDPTPDDSDGLEIETHVSERTFADYVEHQLAQDHAKGAIHREHTFANDREADFVVEGPHHDTVWELENNAGSLPTGMGQAELYRQSRLQETDRSVVAVLCYPEGHVDPEERELLQRSGVVLREFELPEGVDTSGV